MESIKMSNKEQITIDPGICYECSKFTEKRKQVLAESDSIFDAYAEMKKWIEGNCADCENRKKS